jgi:hypothetical protein
LCHPFLSPPSMSQYLSRVEFPEYCQPLKLLDEV